ATTAVCSRNWRRAMDGGSRAIVPGASAAAWPAAAMRTLRQTHAMARVARSTVQKTITRAKPTHDPTSHTDQAPSSTALRSVKWVESPLGIFQKPKLQAKKNR